MLTLFIIVFTVNVPSLSFSLPFSFLTCYEQALLSTVVKRIKGFIKLRKALGSLHAALPDATAEELQVYDDECAICRVFMAHLKSYLRLPSL